MAQEERFGFRPGPYSAWHRRQSTRRFVGMEKAQSLALIDVDALLFLEYDDRTRAPLALIETGLDIGQNRKAAGATMSLAQRARIPAYVCLYRPSERRNPADPSQPDIDRFRIRRLWPRPEWEWRVLTPEQWAVGLVRIREWSARRLDEAANDPIYDQPVPPVAQVASR